MATRSFKEENSFEKRQSLANKIKDAHPDKIPIIVEKRPSSDAPEIAKKKFLAPSDLTVGGFILEIRKQLPIGPEIAIFITVNSTAVPSSNVSLSQIYEEHKDEDGFLYVNYSKETMYGY